MKLWNRFAILCLGVAAVGLLGCPKGDDDDDSSGPVTITVTTGGAGIANLDILFHAADGSVLSQGTTDASGMASADVESGGMVTVVADAANGILATVAGVQGGDNIGVSFPVMGGNNLGNIDVTLAAQGGASFYQVRAGGCGSGTGDPTAGPVTLAVFDDCVGMTSGNVGVLAVAEDAQGGPLAYALDSVAAPSGGGTDTHTQSGWLTNFDTTDVTFTNLPGDVSLVAGIGQASLDGVQYEIPGNSFAPAAAPNLTLSIPPGFDSVSPFFLMPYGGGTNPANADSVGLVIQTTATQPATVTLDGAADFLPAIRTYAEDFTNADRPDLSWTDDGLSGVDGFIIQMFTNSASWTVVSGGDLAGSFQFPELPTSLGINPAASASDSIAIIAADLDWVPDAKAFREGILEIFNDGPPENPSGADSTLKATLAGDAFN